MVLPYIVTNINTLYTSYLLTTLDDELLLCRCQRIQVLDVLI